MQSKQPLYILFTMDCEPAAGSKSREGPADWPLSARSIEGFCNRLLNAGYPATLFVSPRCAEEHTPLLEELGSLGVELALHLHPQTLGDRRYQRHLGSYGAEDQRALIEYGLEQVRDAVGARPQSFRPGNFSASDVTYRVLFELGFRQGSVSNPGRDVPREAALWTGAAADPHYVDPDDRLRAGTLPFLEVPVTTDPTQVGRGGYAYDLCIESGKLNAWHRPIVERRLEQMETEGTAFRTLCVFTHNRFAYHRSNDVQSITLEDLIDYCDALAEQYEVIPTTIAGAHERFIRRSVEVGFAEIERS